MIHPRQHQSNYEYKAFIEQYTPQRGFSKFQSELEKITNKFNRDTRLKKDHTAQKYFPKRGSILNYGQSVSKRKGKENEEEFDIDDKRTASLQNKDSIHSFNQYDQKNLSTFRTQKQQKRYPSKSRDEKIQMNSFSILLKQNQKLAIRVGQLQTACQGLVQKTKATKSKYKQQIKNTEMKWYKQTKEKVYFQKLCYFYKTKALQYLNILKERGINVQNPITQQSFTQESFRFQ